jgi:hypothetical protein
MSVYRAYYGPAGSGRIPPVEKDRWPFKQFANLDAALHWARTAVNGGTAVIAIEGDDGTHLERNEIASSPIQAAPAAI